ncbi:MAG: response regulator transcription factor [Chitinophagaceae bacterium]|nr:response regulator transcription factor [Chitinophagaceae bacterium]
MIKAIIVDDELHCIERLTYLINEFNHDLVQIIAAANTVANAIEIIQKQKPDLVFLDVELGRQNGFEILKQFAETNFKVIFITGHQQYAVQAFRFSAFDYLLKPVEQSQLSDALQKLAVHITQNERNQKIESLLYNLSNRENPNKRLCIPTAEGFTFVETKDIVRCEAMTNYTIIHLKNNQKITVARTLKDYEQLLEDCNFFRIHNSHLVNLKYIKNYKRGKGGTIILSDGTQIEVSTRRKDQFLKRIFGGREY